MRRQTTCFRLQAAWRGWALLGLGLLSGPLTVQAEVKAFPTAEGFGANAKGGRGGRVIEVTNLNDAGPGSLRDCAEATGPRICIFRVSGTITLQGVVVIRNPYLTIAGQTSPGGVQLKGPQMAGACQGIDMVGGVHDIVMRHLRVRLGGPGAHDGCGGTNLLIYGDTADTVHDIIIDHASVSWGTDTQLDAYGNFDNVTLQWNLVAEGADDGTGSGGKGSHIGGWGDPDQRMRVSVHHNVYASNRERSPLIQRAGLFDFRNNVGYNWGGNNGAVFGQWLLNHSAIGNMVNNHYLPGPYGSAPAFALGNGGPTRVDGSPAERGGTKIYSAGNWGPVCPSGCSDDWAEYYTWDYYEWNGDTNAYPASASVFRASAPFSVPAVTTDPTAQVKNRVLANAGATKPFRDSDDTRIVNDVMSGTGRSFNAIGYGGPWPDLASGAPQPPTDSDHDGIPDSWESAHGLNPSSAADGPRVAANGYTHVENYLNELAGDPVFAATMPGDLNGDGKRDLADVRLLIYMLIGQQATTPEADLNSDGAVTLADLQALIKLMVGLS